VFLVDAATCSHQQSLVVSRQQWRGAKPRGKTRLSEKRPAGSQSYKKTWNALKLGMPLADDEAHDFKLLESQYATWQAALCQAHLPSQNALATDARAFIYT